LLRQIGEGDKTTHPFTVPKGTSQWDVAWSYDCPGAVPNGRDGQSNFALVVYKGRSVDVKDASASEGAASDQGTEHYTDTGTLSIHLSAVLGCTWAVSAIVPSG